jgi:outer membrane protein insertion porin family
MRSVLTLALAAALLSPRPAEGRALAEGLRLLGVPDAPTATDTTPWGKDVRSIEVLGTHRVERDAVKAALKFKVGEPLVRSAAAESLRSLFALGYFSDVVITSSIVDPIQVDVQVTVVEKPALRKVLFEGNDEISADDLKEAVDLKPYSILNIASVRRNQKKLREKYVEKGFYLADVTYRLDLQPSNEVDVVYIIREHAKVTVRKVTLIGNKRVPTEDLKAAMQTQEGGWMSFLTQSGTFREEAFEHDLGGIQSVYYDRGFVNVKVGKPQVELSPDKRYLYLSIHIEEGPQYRIGEIDFTGDLLMPKADLLRRMSIHTGEVFNRTKLIRDRGILDDIYQDVGYAYANITPRTPIHEQERVIDLIFDIQKGHVVTIERIDIGGNTKTCDKVIRREMRINEGDRYSGPALRSSKQHIQALGYFESVELTTHKGASDSLAIVQVQVKERPTGTFQVGAGFSNIENFIFTLQVSENNLFGWGQTLSASAQISAIRQVGQIQFVEPYLFDTKFSLSLNLAHSELAYLNFLRSATGGDITFGYELFEDGRLFLTYNLQDEGVSPLTGGLQQVELANQFVKGIISSVKATLTWDKRNDRLFPTSGFMLSQSVEVAPNILGSQFQFSRFSGFARWYYPLILGAVFKTNWTYGIITELGGVEIPISERYFVGGINSLRGYYPFTVSPTKPVGIRSPDTATTDFEVGGTKQLVINNEIEFPIFEKVGIRGLVFYDLGNAYSADEHFFQDKQYNLPLGLLMTVGFGIRWQLPIGPLRFEWGIPLTPRPQDQPVDFEFTIGNFF